MKKHLAKTIIVSLTMCLVLIMYSRAWSEEVKIGAGAAPLEDVFDKIKEPLEKNQGIKLVIISNGPVAAWKDLDKGLVDAAAAGLSFSDWTAMMEKEGYKISDKSAYVSHHIGKDTTRLMLHKGISVKMLSMADLTGIFTGKITNWKELGGPDLPVKVILGSKIPGTLSYFQKQIMAGAPYVKSAVEASTAADVKEKIAATPGSVGLGPQALVDESIAQLGLPLVGRPITLITKGAPSAGVKKIITFIDGEGQEYIK